MSVQSWKKIGQKLLKLESGNEALTDGQTFLQMDIYVASPHLFTL